MDINSTLLGKIETLEKGQITDYGLNICQIKSILSENGNYSERQDISLTLIREILDANGKGEVAIHLSNLAEIEPYANKINENLRDHVIHTLQTYILGIYINEFFLKKKSPSVTCFQWKIACLFHDIGYPVKIGQEFLNKYAQQRNEIHKDLEFNISPIFFEIRPVGINNLSNGEDAFDLIQDCLNSWELQIDAKKEFQKMGKINSISHGIISALSVLNILDIYYQKNNPQRVYENFFERNSRINCNQKFFDNDIVPACTAIFIHDLPPRCFNKSKINREIAPIAYLLKASDSLQEWQRPWKNNENGISPSKFDIKINQRRIDFFANIDIEKIEKIKRDIRYSIKGHDINVEQMMI